MITVLSVFGTRPEAIKMAPVVRELANHPETFRAVTCVTGQHREMLDQVLTLFAIVPDHDLNIMRPNQSLTTITTAVLDGMAPVIQREQPDWVLVQGDTTTAMATALAAFYQRTPVGHVEAGLRTGDRYHPFPEEINRKLIGSLADLHFAPTHRNEANLTREGIARDCIIVTGNTVVDAIQHVVALPFDPASSGLDQLPVDTKRIVLVTAHRREQFGSGIEQICLALRDVATMRDDIHLVYPVHPNPNIQEPVHRLLGAVPNITLLPPLDYRSLVWLIARSAFVVTDSGGIQEEAPGLGKRVIVVRETTERLEAVESGVAILVGTDRARVRDAMLELLDTPAGRQGDVAVVNPYGDGTAARQIVQAIRERGSALAGNR